MKSRHAVWFPLALVLAAPLTVSAQTVATPSDPHGWAGYMWNFSSGTAADPYAEISSLFPRNGNGSVEMRLYDQGTTEAMWYYDLPSAQPLSELSQLSFDWFVSSTSTTPLWTSMAFGLALDNNDYLIWEGAYNGFGGSVPQDTWHSSDLLGGNFWRSGATVMPGQCANAAAYKTLSWFNTNCYGGSAQVVALAPFLGFGYAGTSFLGGLDNISYGFESGLNESFNFEADPTATVPEPATMTLLATGLAGLAAAKRRKRALR